MGTQTFSKSTRLPQSADSVYEWHKREGAFDRLTPPWTDVEVVESSGTIEPGDTKTLKIKQGPVPRTWTLTHRAPEDGLGFDDVQDSGPFASWIHRHRFIQEDQGSTLHDAIEYELPLGPIGEAVAGGQVDDVLEKLFYFRHQRTANDLYRHVADGPDTAKTIAITGASGLVGQNLVPFLRTGGHEVMRLVRDQPSSSDEIYWNPATSEIDSTSLEGVDAVIHLAGASIAGGYWTSGRKKTIRESRVDGTSLLATTLAGLQKPPSVLVSTSAIGYYGDGGAAPLTESSPAGSGFLADVCREWEEAAIPASDAGIRVVHPRLGIVISGDGGVLSILSRVFSLAMGGPLGSGEQFFSWIGMDDLLGILLTSIGNTDFSGPVNAVSPHPVTNKEMTNALGDAVNRPAVFKVPATVMKTVGGDLAKELLLASQNVQPARLENAGFRFMFPNFEQAVRYELGKLENANEAVTVPE